MTLKPSKYQAAIYDKAENTDCNILINACAGSGKTTTIVHLAKLLSERFPGKKIIFLAFNRDIVAELKKKLPANIEVKTLHSFGLNELRFKYGKGPEVVQDKFIDDSKIDHIIIDLAKTWGPFAEQPEEEETEKMNYCNRVSKLVDIMRMCLPQSREELLELCEKFDVQMFNGEIDRAKQVLLTSRKINNKFDFMDMIYRPAIGEWRLKQYDFVIVDECQDMNRAQQKIISRIVNPNGGRMIAVGDPRQAIYGFAGADSNSFDNLRRLFPNTVEMPLSVCYRCPSSVIDHAQEKVSYIEARNGADKGEMRQGSVSEIVDGDFVLCRNTRPLVSLCMQLISQGRKATIKGGDIGKNLINMVRNTKSKTIESVFYKLRKEYQKLVEKAKVQFPLRPAEEVSYVASMEDKIEALITLAKGCKDSDELIATINRIFTDNTSGIVLSTMHKAKGLEADNVFILERFRLPAPYAKQNWEREQEENLDYVARTRAKKKLVYINDWVSDEDKRNDLISSVSNLPKLEVA